MKNIIKYVILMMIFMVSANVYAFEIDPDGFKYYIKDDVVYVYGYTGDEKVLNIPATIEGKPVKSVGGFKGYEIDEVVIPEGVEYLEKQAFYLGRLKKIELPSTLKEIGDVALAGNNLTELDIPDSVEKIGDDCFRDNNLKRISISNKLTYLPRCTFYNNKLEEVFIPKTLKNIGPSAFSSNEITSVHFEDGIEVIGQRAFASNKLKYVEIPDSVVELGSEAFYYNQIGEYELSKNITTISKGTFMDNRIDNIVVPEGITTLGEGSYAYNFAKTIEFPSSLKVIEKEALHANYIASVIIPENVERIEEKAFHSNHNLKNVILSDSVEYIGAQCFKGSNKDLVVNLPLISREGYNVLWRNENGEEATNIRIDGSENPAYTRHYEPIEYTIYYELEDAVNNPDNPTSYNIESEDICIKPPTKKGHTFVYWYGNFDEAKSRIKQGTIGDIYLGAEWNRNKYTLSFDSNGGTSVESMELEYEAMVNDPPPPTKEGYIFAGWYRDEEFETSWSFNENMIEEDTLLYAKWEPIIYNFKLISEGQVLVDINGAPYGEKIPKNDLINMIEGIKEGYHYVGVFTDVSLTEEWDLDNDTIKGDTTIHVKWEIDRFDIELDSNGGTKVSTIEEIAWNTTVDIPTPTKEGHEFMGWYTDASLTKYWDSYEPIKEDMTLYAMWEKQKFMVSFYSDYDPIEELYDVPWDTKIEEIDAGGIKVGYNLVGWYRDEEYTEIWDFDSDRVVTNTDLYAKWEENKYIVKFDTNGGTKIDDVTDVLHWDLITEPTKVPVKEGHTFVGWYSDVSLNNPWDFASNEVTDDTNLYAAWETQKFQVIFYSENDPLSELNDVPWDTKIRVIDTEGIKVGYTLVGWYTDEACTDIWDFDRDKVVANIDLYAKWEENKYIVKFDTNGGSDIEDMTDVLHGELITEPTEVPIKEGHTFVGWYSDVSLNNPWDFASNEVTDDTTLYAAWETQKFKVIFYSENNPISEQNDVPWNARIQEIGTEGIKVGYTLVGWYKNKECTEIWNFDSDRVVANIDLYAKWEQNKYTVMFDTNGGSDIEDMTDVLHGELITEPTENPIKEGHNFIGWYSDVSLSNPWDFATNVVSGDTTLYAGWQLKSYDIVFILDSNEYTRYENINHGEILFQPDLQDKAGYRFEGWYREKNYTDKWDFNWDIVMGEQKLYGKWIKINSNNSSKKSEDKVSNDSSVKKAMKDIKEDKSGKLVASANVRLKDNSLSLPIPEEITNNDGKEKILKLKNEDFEVDIPSRIFKDLSKNQKANINIQKLEDESGFPSYNVEILVDDKPITDMNMIINMDFRIKYELDSEEKEEVHKYVVYFKDNNGNITIIKDVLVFETGAKFETFMPGEYGVKKVDKSFDDMEGSKWANEAVESLAARGIVKGTNEAEFSPKSNMTRGQFITILTRFFNYESTEGDNFRDVDSEKYYSGAILTAKTNGIVDDEENNEFKPEKDITREEMMKYFAKALMLSGKDLPITRENTEDIKDLDKIKEGNMDYVLYMIKLGLIKGDDNNIHPENNATRAEAVQLFYNVLVKIN